MRLTVNGEPVAFTLEAEERLGQVVEAVERWLAGEGFLPTGFSADGEPLDADVRSSWAARPLDGLGELAVSARTAAELRLEHWAAVAGFLACLAAALERPSASSLVELAPTIDDALAGLASNPAGAEAAELVGRLRRALPPDDAAGAAASWPEERRRQAAELARSLATSLSDRMAEAAAPAAALAARTAVLEGLPARLAEVPVQLATGRDRDALATVGTLSSALDSLLALIPFLPRDRERSELLGGLSAVLRDLAAALEARDTVLAGDLAEYEVAPRVGGLVDVLRRQG